MYSPNRFLTLTLLAAPLLGASCVTADDTQPTLESGGGAIVSSNGLSSINGLSSYNGLTSVNGLSSYNGLSSINGLSSYNGLMTTSDGRNTVSYIVRCALPAGRSIAKVVNGATYKFQGELGMAPEWETGACGKDCQEKVSACVLAHVNTSGQHIALYLDSETLGWGQNSDYPYQEGSFFGNIFVDSPAAYYCNGKDFDQGLVPGRLGATSNSPYKNPFAGGSSYCRDNCASADYPYNKDGYKACGGWRHVVTVWRNFDPNTDYKVCSRYSGKCLDVGGASTANGAQLIQYRFTGGRNQMWRIYQVSPGQYKFINVNSGKALDINGGWAGDGAQLIQYSYNGGSNQMWSFTPQGDGYYKFSPGSNPNGSLDVKGWSKSDGAIVQQYHWSGGANQQWSITPAY